MHTVEMLSLALDLARRLGYQIREDQLEGAGGGHCLIRGQKWLLLDLTQSAEEQLRDVLDAVRGDRQLDQVDVPSELADSLSRERPLAA